MATPFGTNEVNSLSRRFIIPTVYDNLYKSNLLFFRLNARNKRVLQGGLQIEAPLIWQKFAAGGPYQGYDLLDVSPSDTIKNAAWDWKQYYVPVSVSGLDLARADSPEQVVNFLGAQFENAQMELADQLGTGIYTDGVTNIKHIDGLKGAIDDTTVLTTYAGLSRTTNTFWKSIVSTVTPMTLIELMTQYGKATEGGRHPTIFIGQQIQYTRYWNLSTGGQSFPVQPGGHDEQLAQNGFTNLIFNGVPWCVDSHVGDALTLYALNEDYIQLFVNPRADFAMKDFREPVNQDAMTSLILWLGNMVVTNCARHVKWTSIAG